MSPRDIGALVALIEQGRLGEAQERALALLKTHAGTGIVWKILSVALVRQGKDALQALRRAAQLMPQDAEAQANLGAGLYDRGQWHEALESLRRALELDPRNLAALIDAANALRALGRPRESVPLYQRALEIDARNAEGCNNLGNAYLELAQPLEAAECYRRTLGVRPDDAQVHLNLANALRQLGQFPEAIDSSERAIALDPRLAMAHNNLGLCLAGLGQRERAVESYRKALALDGTCVEALNNLGDTLRDLGAPAEALALHRKAVELDPQRPESHWSLGNALFDLRRLDEAAASYRHALTLRAEYPQALLALAAVLRMQGRASEAEERCRAVLALQPRCADALARLGELRADRGRFAEAQQLFEQALSFDPDYPSAYCSIAAHRKMTDADRPWVEGAERLLATPLPLAHQINLRYALGKYFDDLARYDEAFDHYRQANELTRRQGARYDRAKLTQRVDRIIRRFDEAFLGECRRDASASELPVFIIGMPRSGTSLTEQILASHPSVFGAGELRFWNAAFDAFEHDGAAASLLPHLARDYLERLRALAAAPLRVIDKMPANFLHAGLIHATLPRARIIHMQRHPLDTCLSIYFQNFFTMGPQANDLDDLAHYYGEYLRLSRHWRSLLPATTLLEVPYESLVADQEGWTRRMLDFIGLPWDPKCLDFHETDRVVITASRWQVRQKITAGSIGRWRNYEQHLGPLRHLAEATG